MKCYECAGDVCLLQISTSVVPTFLHHSDLIFVCKTYSMMLKLDTVSALTVPLVEVGGGTSLTTEPSLGGL